MADKVENSIQIPLLHIADTAMAIIKDTKNESMLYNINYVKRLL